ncbi:MAG TPA: TraR/DksA C4-type zinc finger protein [Planctomycetota bacterium]|nr:TraR/DksA C4-type zinc finger protein [Planctomycetota bacterium]
MPKLKKKKAAPAKLKKASPAKSASIKKKIKKEAVRSKPPAEKSNTLKKEAKVLKNVPPKPLTAELIQVRERLQQMLTELRKDIDHEVRGASDRDLAHINDTSDMASDAAEGDLSLRIAESETVEAGEIERAIEKIDNGTYGTCEMCNKPINADRLQFLPFATHCIKCQELAEIRKREEGDELDDLAEGSDDGDNG